MMRMNARTQWKMLIQQQGRLRRCLPSYSSVPVREEQSFEQERASKLEHQGMLKTTHHLLGQQRLDSSHVRDARLVLNYWTSPRVKRHHPGHEGLASQVFDLLLERAEPSTFEQVIKTDTSTVGGLVYLVEHLLYSFRLSDLSSFLMMGSRTEDQRHLLESLKQATNALTVMHDLLSEQASRDDMMAFKVLEVNLWYKRAWFLNEFRGQLKDLSEDDWVIAFDRVRTAQECLAIMTGMAEELCQTHNPGPMVVQKIYTMLISGWVYSGLPNAMDMSLELLNELEEKPELGELSPIPYNAIMYLCAVNRNAELAWQFWKHMTAPDSGVEPDAATLASLLLTFVRTDQLDRAIELLNHVEGQVGISSTATNTTCYNVVLDGLAKSQLPRALKEAEALLNRMMELTETTINPHVAPDKITFSTVMRILSGKSALKAEQLLIQCKKLAGSNPAMKPDRIMHNIVLDAYANQRNQTMEQRAISLLRTMEESGDTSVKPDTVSYNSVLHACCKSSAEDASKIVEDLFEEMKRKLNEGDESTKPDIVTYNIVLRALARNPDCSIDRVQSFLDEMRLNNTPPDTVTYNTLMDSIIKSRKPGAAELAEGILRKMEAEYAKGNLEVKPDARSYNTVLNGYAKVGSIKSANRAEQLLREMMLVSSKDSERKSCKPDVVSISSVLNAYAKSTSPDAGTKAEMILNDMEKCGILPNRVCYNVAISCWVNSNQSDAPIRAESLLNRMQQDYESGHNPAAKPDAVSFSAVVDCWAKSNDPERALKIFRRLEMLAEAGDKDMQPNAISYSIAISAIGRSSQSDSSKQVIALLDRAEENYFSGKTTLQPTAPLYNCAINAIAKGVSENKAQEALSLLERLKTRYCQTGSKELSPSAISYSSVINACAYTKAPEKKNEAFRISREVFKELLEKGSPTSICYTNFLSACLRLLPTGKNRDEIASAMFLDCVQRGLVNRKIIYYLQQTVSPETYAELSVHISSEEP